MASYTAKISWKRNNARFTDNRYSRFHLWEFDGGEKVSASASSHIVPVPFSDPSAVDPEEAFVAALSSCHMLWFLSIAAKRGFVIDNYEDKAEGILGKDSSGRLAMTQVKLSPQVSYTGSLVPTLEEDTQMHHKAHEECFIANSVRTEIHIESSMNVEDAV